MTRLLYQPLFAKARTSLYVLTAVWLSGSALISTKVYAQAACTPPSASEPGVHVPTGSDAAMFSYNCDSGLWESAYYIYSPTTGITSPKTAPIYTYNDATGNWDALTCMYVASQGAYAERTISVTQPPAGAATVGGPKPAPIPDPSPTPTQEGLPAAAEAPPANANTPVPTTTTPDGGTSGTSNTTTMSVNNSVLAQAATGNAIVFANTAAGDAVSGNAQSMATLVNMLQSSASGMGNESGAVFFTTDIQGDVVGDLLLDPAHIGSVQPAAASPAGTLAVTTANNTTQAIHNTITLSAASGNAAVDSNTNAGNATSGSATAVANVVNMLNSAITSGKSFLGVININGNLNGDILLPPNLIDQLLASNVPTVQLQVDNTLANATTQSINNTITTAATTGNAQVDRNTTAGSARTGAATTNITAFNLTGSTVVGKNSLIVFVNVLGTWYGMIVDAPAGSTSAQLGGGIAPGAPPTTTATAATNFAAQSIRNDISLVAHTGDASVTKNTRAGNATSGDARVAANVLNIMNSTISLSDWFGILFINVFGSWHGSFGVNTSAGDVTVSSPPPSALPQPPSNSTPSAGAVLAQAAAPRQVFRFIARSLPRSTPPASATPAAAQETSQVLSETTAAPVATTTKLPVAGSVNRNRSSNLWLSIFGIGVATVLLVGERVVSRRHR